MASLNFNRLPLMSAFVAEPPNSVRMPGNPIVLGHFDNIGRLAALHRPDCRIVAQRIFSSICIRLPNDDCVDGAFCNGIYGFGRVNIYDGYILQIDAVQHEKSAQIEL